MSTIASDSILTAPAGADFLTFCGKLMVAAPFGLAITDFLTPEAVAQVVGAARRPSVIWLHMQDCTGCTRRSCARRSPTWPR
jgi:hydrogenase small subunit